MVLQSEFIELKDNTMYIDGVDCKTLVEQYGTPLYVMSKGHLQARLEILRSQFLNKFDNVLPLFASKSFSCLAMYRLVKEYNIGLDVVSAGEMSIALKAGIDSTKIYFHGNNKTPQEIEYALDNNVFHFVVDNFYEIEIIEKIAAQKNKKVYATMRVTPGVQAGANAYIQTGATDTKFGFSTHDGTYLKAIRQVIDSKYIEFEGIHCHIGSQIEDIQAYIDAMNKFVGFAYDIYDNFGIVIEKLNAGGGYGIAYTKDNKPLDFIEITETIVDIVTKGFEAKGWQRPMILIEPGRYVVGNAGVTLYTVGSTKDIPGVRKYISVDGGMTDNIRASLYGAKYDAIIVNKSTQEANTLVTIAGKNCESGDILRKDIYMADPQAGDILAMYSTGAYHYSMSSNYNQLTKPPVVFVDGGKSNVVVRRQTFEDLIAYDM